MGGTESTAVNPCHCSAFTAWCESRGVSLPPTTAAMMQPLQCNAVCFQALGLSTTQHQHSNDAYLLSPCSSILQALWHLLAQLATEYDTAIPIIHSFHLHTLHTAFLLIFLLIVVFLLLFNLAAKPQSLVCDMTAIFMAAEGDSSRRGWQQNGMAAEGDATNSASFAAGGGVATQTRGGGFRSLTTIVCITGKATCHISKLVPGTICTNCLFCWVFKSVWLRSCEACPYFHMLPMVQDQQRQAASALTCQMTSLSPAAVPKSAVGSAQLQAKSNSFGQ